MAITRSTSNIGTGDAPEQASPLGIADLPEEDQALRPTAMDDFVGQSSLKDSLKVVVQAAKMRGESCPHMLFYGPPGLGKTTLAKIIATEMGVNFRVTSGASIEKTGDLAAIVSSLEVGDVLFLDEIHRLRRPLEEMLYPVMEDFALDLVVGSGPSARPLRLQIPRFTLVAATTRLSSMSNPLRDRFGEHFRLTPYTESEIAQLLDRNADLLQLSIAADARDRLSAAARGTPRIANRLLRRLRDIGTIAHKSHLEMIDVEHLFTQTGIDQRGLTDGDRELLELVIRNFAGGPVGLKTLSAALHEEPETVEEVYEPYLLREGLLQRTPQGRVALEGAYTHLGFPYNPPQSRSSAPQLFSPEV